MAKTNAEKTKKTPHTKTVQNPIKRNSSKPSARAPESASRPADHKQKTPRRKQSSGGSTKINHFEQLRLDRIREKDERKANKEEKQLLRKKERIAKLKILTKKNRKGQPIMGGRMELLLKKIQKGCQ